MFPFPSAANLPLASLRIETPELLFTRDVTFAVPEVSGEGICERTLGHAVIYRIGVDGKSEARLEIPVEKQIRSRELILLIRNEDSPPLAITGISGEQRLIPSVARSYAVPLAQDDKPLALSFADLRDKTTLLYFNHVEPGMGVYSVLARVTSAGTFHWPATQAVPMYDSRFSGVSAASEVHAIGE